MSTAARTFWKERRPDEWDPPIMAYDPYGPGDEFIDD
jgi:hypothetical protein